MASSYIAPGVYSEEVDLSLYVPQLSTSILGLVGVFPKGPVNTITFISNRTQFEQVFGSPLRGELGFAAHTALYFLRWGNQLKVVRVGDSNIAQSSANILGNDPGQSVIGQFLGVTEGQWADGLQVTIDGHEVPTEEDASVFETVYIIKVYTADAGIVDELDPLIVDFTGWQPLEIWNDVQFDDPTKLNYVEKVINGNSIWISVQMSKVGMDPDTTVTATLAGGNDGSANVQATDIIGSFDSQTGIYSGIMAFEDPLVEDINLLSAPGFNHDRDVADALITTAIQRFDCLAILDTPDVRTAQDMADYVKGSLGSPGNPWAGYAPLGSSNRAAIFGPWVKIFDSYNNEEIFVPPSVRVCGVFAFNDNVAYPWFASAGPNRGILYNTLDVRFRLTQGDVEYIYGFGVNINPIKVQVDGILIDGNKTLQRKPSLLQYINVVRMLMYAEKVIATVSRYLQWEPHDEITWNRYRGLVSPFLQDIVTKRGITAFSIKCDKETNTDFYIDRGQMVAELHIIPVTAIGVIVNRYVIHPHGTNLESSTLSGTQQTLP